VIIVADETKLVDKLGRKAPVPIEIVPFALETVCMQLQRWGGEARLRQRDGHPFLSDNGNLILDWHYGVIDEPQILEKQLKAITGVVDSGIFANIAECAIVATASGLHRLNRPL
jgi:ribose 5-phosphate isomerase A